MEQNPGERGFEPALGALTGRVVTVEALTLTEQEALVAVTTLGDLHATQTTIMRTEDAGVTWEKAFEASGDWTEWAHSGQTIWWTSHIYTEGRLASIFRSVDGGRTWTHCDLEGATGLQQPRHARYRSLQVRSELYAQVERDDPTSDTQVYWSTTDGGETWLQEEAWQVTAPVDEPSTVRVLTQDDRSIVQRRDGMDWWTVATFQPTEPSR